MIVSVTIANARETEIEGAIESVLPHVDRVLVVDTGVTDSTLDRAEKVAGKKWLSPVRHEWRDFAAARNAALDAARQHADWIVVVDTDERLAWGSVDLRTVLESPTADVLMVEAGDGSYPKEKILRASAPLRYDGPTHEVLLGGSRDTLRGVVFHELSKSWEQLQEKARRDVVLLAKHLETHGYDGRWWHYLGLSYEMLGQRDEAAHAFEKASCLKGQGVEALWSAYKHAEQRYFQGRYLDAIQAAARGLGTSALNPECAWMAALSAQRHGLDQEAAAWARIAATLGLFQGHGTPRAFFRHLPAHYELPYDVLRSVAPTQEERDEAARLFHKAKIARLGASDDASLDRVSISETGLVAHRNEARGMLRPPLLQEFCPGLSNRPLLFQPPGGLHPMNPSVVWHRGRLVCNVRAVNYTMQGKTYVVRDPDKIVRTENYLGWLAADGSLRDARRVEDLDPAARNTKSLIQGYEDIRLVSIDGRLYGSATVCDRGSDRRLIAKLSFTEEGDVAQADVLPPRQQHEKNWMPYEVNGDLRWVYKLDPTLTCTEAGDFYRLPCRFNVTHLRGGAITPYEGGWLAIVHDSIDTDDGRIYLHRFLRLSDNMAIRAVSRAFVFQHHGIEFACGIAEDGDEVVVTYGLRDHEAWIARVSKKELGEMPWMT